MEGKEVWVELAFTEPIPKMLVPWMCESAGTADD